MHSVESDQLEVSAGISDQQTSILAQMNVKISRVLGKSTAERLDLPFAFMIGKCDIWHLILNPISKDGRLRMSVIDSNSEIMRNFMNEYAPELVATVERLSNQVRYFPISAFGHKPRSYTIQQADGSEFQEIA